MWHHHLGRRFVCSFGENPQGQCLVDPDPAPAEMAGEVAVEVEASRRRCSWPVFLHRLHGASRDGRGTRDNGNDDDSAGGDNDGAHDAWEIVQASCGFSATVCLCRRAGHSAGGRGRGILHGTARRGGGGGGWGGTDRCNSGTRSYNGVRGQKHNGGYCSSTSSRHASRADTLVIAGRFLHSQQQQQRNGRADTAPQNERMVLQSVDLRRVWQLSPQSAEQPVHLQRFQGRVGTVRQVSVGNSHLLLLNERGQAFVTGDDPVSTGLSYGVRDYYLEPHRGEQQRQRKSSSRRTASPHMQQLRLFYHTQLAQYEPIRFVNASFRYSVVIGTDPIRHGRSVVLTFGTANYSNLGCPEKEHANAINIVKFPASATLENGRGSDMRGGDNEEMGQFIKVASGFAHVITLTSTGRCFSHGYGYHGELATGKCEEVTQPVEITHVFGGSRIKDISCGTFHSVFLTMDNEIYMCGRNVEHQCSHFTNRGSSDSVFTNSWNHSGSVLTPVKVDLGAPIRIIEACGKSTIAVTEDERLFITGNHFELSRSTSDDNIEDGTTSAQTVIARPRERHPLNARRRFRFTHVDLARYCPLGMDLSRYRVRSISSGDSHVALTFEERNGVTVQSRLHSLQRKGNAFSDIDIVCRDRV